MSRPDPPPTCSNCGAPQLSLEQRRVLELVQEHPGISHRVLAGMLNVSKGTVSHHVQALKKAGLLSVERDVEDARVERLRARAPGRTPRDEAILLAAADDAIAALQRLRARLQDNGAPAALPQATGAAPLSGAPGKAEDGPAARGDRAGA